MNEEIRILLVNNLKPEDYMIITDNFRKLDKEIERLNNIINELEQENKVLLEKYSTIQILYNSSKLKNEKAIEYIKTKEVDFVDVHYQQQDDYFDGLLNILQGGDK